jgi:hypothetical protein
VIEQENDPPKLTSSSEDNMIVPWNSFKRCGKGEKSPKEIFVSSKEALGSQN